MVLDCKKDDDGAESDSCVHACGENVGVLSHQARNRFMMNQLNPRATYTVMTIWSGCRESSPKTR